MVRRLAGRGRIWRLLDYQSCRFCGRPRRPEHARDFPTCYDCGQLAQKYDQALEDLVPLTLTTPSWAVGAGLREWKDDFGCRPHAIMAPGFAAIWSAFLEKQLPRLAPPLGFGVITTVPSSRPTVVVALQRAATEGWWVPQVTEVASSDPKFPRQRERAPGDRSTIEGKWQVSEDAVLGQDALVLDDITTSGGSVHSFARALRNAGAQSVRAVVMARNVSGDGDWILPLLQAQFEEGLLWTPDENKHDIIR